MTNTDSTVNGVSITLIFNGKALLQLRDNKKNIPNPNLWGFTSGRIFKKESYKEAAKRELFEETGYLSKNPIFYMSETLSFPYYGKKNVQVFRYYEIYDGVQKIECFEGQKVEFFSLKEIKNLETVPGTYLLTKKILSCIN